jgi:hypothetical protein
MTPDQQLAAAGWIGLIVTAGGILFQAGALREQIRNLERAVLAIHRRIDEIEASHQQVREVLIAQGAIEAGTSPGRRNPLLDQE